MNKPTTDFFNKEAAQRYDERNSKLSRISDCLHFLSTLVLKDLPEQSRILCVGVGTGAEIMTLAEAFPQWRFIGVDPSANMLEVCRERMTRAGYADRCEFVHGYVQDAPTDKKFDAVVSLLVSHFVHRPDRPGYFQHMTDRLKDGGILVNAEISFDLNSSQFPAMLKGWEAVQTLMGATPESLANLPKQLKEMLTVLPPEETEQLIQQSGIAQPIRFFQAFMICAWFGKK